MLGVIKSKYLAARELHDETRFEASAPDKRGGELEGWARDGEERVTSSGVESRV